MEISESRLQRLNLTQEKFDKIRKEIEIKIEEKGITEDLNSYITERINEETNVVVNFFA